VVLGEFDLEKERFKTLKPPVVLRPAKAKAKLPSEVTVLESSHRCLVWWYTRAIEYGTQKGRFGR